jgi:hypothetical protein
MANLGSIVNNIFEKVRMPKDFGDFQKMDLKSQLIFTGIAGLSTIVTVKVVNRLFGTDPLGRSAELFGKFSVQEKSRGIKVENMIDNYNDLHDDTSKGLEERNSQYSTLVNAYYELATSFYEWGWGQSFHFAYQLKGETFQQAIARHEYYLAGRLGVKAGDKILDCGCGVGGPMRNIARFTRAKVTGVTLNEVGLLIDVQ